MVGGYFDPEYQRETRQLWELWKSGRYRFISSVVVEEEIEPAPEQVRRLYAHTFPEQTRLSLTMAAIELARLYVESRVVTPKYLSDARHVAVCSVAAVSHLVSWNFRHLVNVEREAGFNAINLLQGYAPIRIVSPLELIYAP
ncbi:MAG TPA: hypothetical protein VHY09_04300 [Candidatus Methylacidiphilales bacterium]|nr:hypothetical protein [Candidatus Methylacidiphilales bacterium]